MYQPGVVCFQGCNFAHKLLLTNGAPHSGSQGPSFARRSLSSRRSSFLCEFFPTRIVDQVGIIELACTLQCSALSKALPSEVFSPGKPENNTYTLLNNARWSKTTILAPGCIFQPTSVDHVSKGIQVLVAGLCQFAIKSGGHNPIPGANNINGGVSIDLGLLNQISLSADRTSVSLGAGGRWGAAYDAFADDGILFPGGLCGPNGVGGVSIGGGQSYVQPRVGWVVDNVLNYEIVLASGKIVNANQTSHSDLYKALKGGGNNFGIVTQVDVAAFEQGDIWAGEIIVPGSPQTLEATLQATVKFTAQNNVNPNLGAQIVVTYSNGSAIIVFSIASTDGIVNPEGLQSFTAVQPQIANTVKLRSLGDVVHELDKNQDNGFRCALRSSLDRCVCSCINDQVFRDAAATVTFVNDYKTLSAVQNVSDAVLASIKDRVPNLDFILFYVPLPKVAETHSAPRGGNVLGLADRDKDLICETDFSPAVPLLVLRCDCQLPSSHQDGSMQPTTTSCSRRRRRGPRRRKR